MKIWNRLAAAVACVLALLGCAEPQILDGPGMVNDRIWRAIELTSADGTMDLTVRDDGRTYFLWGQCRDPDGRVLMIEDPVELNQEDGEYLMDLDLPFLPSGFAEDAAFHMTLTRPNGDLDEKMIEAELAMEIYQRLLPYFTK